MPDYRKIRQELEQYLLTESKHQERQRLAWFLTKQQKHYHRLTNEAAMKLLRLQDNDPRGQRELTVEALLELTHTLEKIDHAETHLAHAKRLLKIPEETYQEMDLIFEVIHNGKLLEATQAELAQTGEFSVQSQELEAAAERVKTVFRDETGVDPLVKELTVESIIKLTQIAAAEAQE